ncbi:MAG: hypothetical protein H7319_13075 [Spirosoma sp.]|nr:hypothetical protein [Spirosoma sp.]
MTNNQALISSSARANELTVQEIPFTLPVPTGIRFYAAHFKADVPGLPRSMIPYVGLVDKNYKAVIRRKSEALAVIRRMMKQLRGR